MTTKKAKQLIKKAGGKWEDFMDFMFGQTYGINKDGSSNWYKIDVERFIRSISKNI